MKVLAFFKSKYIKRTGGPGKYQYTYKESIGKKVDLSNVTKSDIQRLKSDKSYMNQFIKENQGFVRSTAGRMISDFSNMNNAIQDANIGFFEAIKNFNIKKSPKAFLEYIKQSLRGNILNGFKERINREETSLDVKVKEGELSEKIETIEDPTGKVELENVEFRSTIENMKTKMDKRSGQILELMAGEYKKSEIADILKISKAAITKRVQRDIEPIANKYLRKSMRWYEFLMLIKQFAEE